MNKLENDLGVLVPQNDYRYNADKKEIIIFRDLKIFCLNCNNPIVNVIKESKDIMVLAKIFAEEKRKNSSIDVLEEIEPGEKCIKLDEVMLYDSREEPPKEFLYYKVLINGNMYWMHSNNYVSFKKLNIENIVLKKKYNK